MLMHNLFNRTERPPMFDFAVSPGDELTMKRIAELAGPLTPEAAERDASDYVEFLAAHDSVSEGAMGVVGHCFSGSMAMRTAAAPPDRICAAASFHGGGLFTDAPMSPHFVVPCIKAQLYFGARDQGPERAGRGDRKARPAARGLGGKYEREVYEGGYHSWTVSDSPVYNPDQAERAFENLTELFRKALK